MREQPWTIQMIEWWQLSSRWDGTTGHPSGPPEWPEPGGILSQPANLVEAVRLLRSEWNYVHEGRARDH